MKSERFICHDIPSSGSMEYLEDTVTGDIYIVAPKDVQVTKLISGSNYDDGKYPVVVSSPIDSVPSNPNDITGTGDGDLEYIINTIVGVFIRRGELSVRFKILGNSGTFQLVCSPKSGGRGGGTISLLSINEYYEQKVLCDITYDYNVSVDRMISSICERFYKELKDIIISYDGNDYYDYVVWDNIPSGIATPTISGSDTLSNVTSLILNRVPDNVGNTIVLKANCKGIKYEIPVEVREYSAVPEIFLRVYNSTKKGILTSVNYSYGALSDKLSVLIPDWDSHTIHYDISVKEGLNHYDPVDAPVPNSK